MEKNFYYFGFSEAKYRRSESNGVVTRMNDRRDSEILLWSEVSNFSQKYKYNV